ncbi:hypothetical protein, partial [Caballeronia grimmiae]|uniref:hypothetical protein n=1 Tax=Caballeronia grimmiae TaxID=1071679 RepID=UPI0038BA7C98
RDAASHTDYCTDQLSARQKRGVRSEHRGITDAFYKPLLISCGAAKPVDPLIVVVLMAYHSRPTLKLLLNA